jgi:putative membrane protein
MNTLIKLIINAIAVYITAYLLPGVHLTDFIAALAVVIVLSAANLLVKPILIFLTLPITIITLGLFTLVINALIVLITDALIAGFQVDSFIWALLFSLTLSLVDRAIEYLARS